MLRTTFFALISMAVLDFDHVTAINLDTSIDTNLGSDTQVAAGDAQQFNHDSLDLSEVDAQPPAENLKIFEKEKGKNGA